MKEPPEATPSDGISVWYAVAKNDGLKHVPKNFINLGLLDMKNKDGSDAFDSTDTDYGSGSISK